jgi:hypothetical protein
MDERNDTFTPPVCLQEVEMNNYTVAENCQHLQAELKKHMTNPFTSQSKT